MPPNESFGSRRVECYAVAGLRGARCSQRSDEVYSEVLGVAGGGMPYFLYGAYANGQADLGQMVFVVDQRVKILYRHYCNEACRSPNGTAGSVDTRH